MNCAERTSGVTAKPTPSSSVAVRPFDDLIFDLDDTLLDTYRQLVPKAARESCAAMIAAGLDADIEHCLMAWSEHGRQYARRELFSHLIELFGVTSGSDEKKVALAGHLGFYNRQVDADISLFPGAAELLEQLAKNYVLHLVTAGSRETQEQKIQILGIAPYFRSISHVDPSRSETKLTAFAAIERLSGRPAARHLSIGNRIDSDIRDARALGWKTVWVRYGEHANLLPNGPEENPDFVIDSITELAQKCQL